MVHSISAAQCLSSGWCFSCISSAHFRPKWDACWSWFLLKTENHYLHQQNWMQTGNQRKSIRKSKKRLFHLSNWKMVLLLSRAAASNFVHYHKPFLSIPKIRTSHQMNIFFSLFRRKISTWSSSVKKSPKLLSLKVSILWNGSCVLRFNSQDRWDRFLLGPCLFEAKKCWFYAWWSLSDPNCCREISGLEGCLK